MYYLNSWVANPTHLIKVLLIGVGGTGSHLAVELVNLSLILEELERFPLNITLCDGDIVEEHNVGRQKFYPSDVGLNKAEVMANRISRSFNYGIDYLDEMVDKTFLNKKLHEFNIVITAVDNVKTRKLIDKCLKQQQLRNNPYNTYYWLDCGNSEKSGQVILSSYHEKENLSSVLDLFPKMKDDKNEPSCSMRESILRQGFMINKWTSIMAMEMLSSLLLDFALDYNQVYFNLSSMLIKTNEI